MAAQDISTFVFLDLEMTGLPDYNCNKANITELAMIACKKDDFLEFSGNAELPRATNKLVLCFNPEMKISPVTEQYSGLNNYMLEHHKKLDVNAVNSIIRFVNHQSSPVCLLAHYGEGHDFQLLKKSMEKHNLSFSDDILCCDTLLAFREIDRNLKVCKEKAEEKRKNKIDAANTALQENQKNAVTTEIENQEITEMESLWDVLLDEQNAPKISECASPKRPTEPKNIRPHKSKSATFANERMSKNTPPQQCKFKRSLVLSETDRRPAFTPLKGVNQQNAVATTAAKVIKTNAEEQEITDMDWEDFLDEKNAPKINECASSKRPTEKENILPQNSRSAALANETMSKNTTMQQLKVKRSLFHSKPDRKPYSLPNLYERRFGRKPEILHKAEEDVINLIKVAMDYGKDFVEFVGKNSIPFNTIKSKFI